jgi:hypothetical protein
MAGKNQGGLDGKSMQFFQAVLLLFYLTLFPSQALSLLLPVLLTCGGKRYTSASNNVGAPTHIHT